MALLLVLEPRWHSNHELWLVVKTLEAVALEEFNRLRLRASKNRQFLGFIHSSQGQPKQLVAQVITPQTLLNIGSFMNYSNLAVSCPTSQLKYQDSPQCFGFATLSPPCFSSRYRVTPAFPSSFSVFCRRYWLSKLYDISSGSALLIFHRPFSFLFP